MSSSRLNQETLARLASTARHSPLRGHAFGTGILHLGIGAFHRAHQAIFTQAAMAARPGDWGILGVSLRSPGVRDILAAQDHLYSVTTLAPGHQATQVVSVVKDVLYAPEDPSRVVAALADPAIKIVTLTITEKGYGQDPASGRRRRDDAAMGKDLDLSQAPRTALGFLLRGLLQRRQSAAGPITLLSCDNLPENGRVLAGLLREICAEAAQDLLPWLAEAVTCPSSMVDGIVPAATPASLRQAESYLGLRDEAAIVCEDFRQWVIEDNFAAERPAWEAAGAEIVSDVRPYETMKLRLLNGSHSALAYLGALGGYETIAETMADPRYKAFATRLMRTEAGPAISLPAGTDLLTYSQSLIRRFCNPALAHRTRQIAMDGSQKLPQRLLASLYGQLPSDRPMPCTLLAVAAWMYYVGGRDETGGSFKVHDPLAARFAALHAAAKGNTAAVVAAFLGVSEVFGPPARQPGALAGRLTESLTALRRDGARACVGRLADFPGSGP